MIFYFPRTFGQDEAKESLRQALGQNRFPHALLLHGESGLGQHALLMDLAHILSCDADAEARPCGHCASCRAFKNRSLDTLHYLLPLLKKDKKEERETEKDDDESLESAQIEEMTERIRILHENPYAFARREKAQASVGQVRHLLSRLRYAENHRARLVLVPYLEALNDAAANALLKALEEPPAGVYFLIASEHRAALLPTLLSRCLHLGLAPLPAEEFHRAAAAMSLRAEKPFSARLLPFAEGSPGAYLQLLEQDGETLLEEASRFLSAATAEDWRVFAEYAEQRPDVKDAEATLLLLNFLLRCLRLQRVLRVRHPGPSGGRADGYRWTANALKAESLDPSLSGTLGPLEDVPDVTIFAAYLEAAIRAVQGYCNPRNALLGLFLEYEAKVRRAVTT